LPLISDIRTWHANIEQHASEGVNKILIGNKSDWTDKKAVTEEQGRELANELGIKFMETSAKVNEGVEEAFFTLARLVSVSPPLALNLTCAQGHQNPPHRLARRRQRRSGWPRGQRRSHRPTRRRRPRSRLLLMRCPQSCSRLALPACHCCARSPNAVFVRPRCNAMRSPSPVELSLAYRPP
jgi:Ras-related protein Rab-8A